MSNVGRKVYFDIITGEVLVVTSEMEGDVLGTTVEQDINIYKVLSERNIDSFDVIELEFGEYAKDFMSSNKYSVNVDTKELLFNYPNPNDPDEEPIFRKSLGEEVEELKNAQSITESDLAVIVMESMNDKLKISQLENDLGNAVLEIMTMKIGGL